MPKGDGWLVIGRRVGESVMVGEAEVKVLRLNPAPGKPESEARQVQLAIRAPRHIQVVRDDAHRKERS